MSAALQYLCRCSVYSHPCRCEDCGKRAVKRPDAEIDRMIRDHNQNVVRMVEKAMGVSHVVQG
jgi:hypothetical protein